MRASRSWVLALVVTMVISGAALAGKGGRWAGRGAAGGAVLGLLVGDDLGDVAVGAAVGAAAGGIAGSASEKREHQRQQQAELEALRRNEAERQSAEAAQPKPPADLPQTEEAWIRAIGVDNTNALDALVECQQARARLLAQAGATFENPEFRLVAKWLEALAALDLRDTVTAERLFSELIELDNDVDTPQQASLLADQALLEIRNTRRNEGITCN